MPEVHPGTDIVIASAVPTSPFRNAIPNVKRYMKPNRWELENVGTAALEGDFELLETLLATGDEYNLFNGDLNGHVTTFTPLHLAAGGGHTECVDLLLRAKADPHIRERMPYGQDPEDGRTALEMARGAGWDDIAGLLEQAEKQYPYGWYVPVGLNNNAKVYGCWEWGTKPERGWYLKRPGAARKHGLDPKRYGAEDYELPDEDFITSTPALPPMAGARPLPIGLMFPDIGSRYVKMMSSIQDLPAVKALLEKAKAVLGFDILPVCLSGPQEKLDPPSISSPAMFVACMAGLEKLRQDRAEAVERCKAVTGMSLGELTALCAAGVFSFEDGLTLARLRGQLLEEASRGPAQAEVTVAGLPQDRLAELCAEAERFEGAGAVCKISMALFERGYAVAGSKKAADRLKETAEQAGALQCKMQPARYALHTSLMESAQDRFAAAIDGLLPKMKPPRCHVYMNATGSSLRPGASVQDVADALKAQMTSPVLWNACLSSMVKDGITEFYEVGPMKQLKSMMKRIDAKVWETTYNVDV